MGGSKYNRLLGNKFIYKYKHSMEQLTSLKKNLSTKEYDNYNYLQQSIIPTYHFQKSLTKLAIPKLEDTINRYLNALKPILNENEWKDAEKIARDFEKNEGKVLDKEIRELDAKIKDSNYISEPWFDMYLRARESIVLNYNPFIAYVPDPNPKQMNQAIRATNLLISSIRFMKSLRSNKLKPEIFHLNPEKSDTIFFQRLMRLIPEKVAFYGAYLFNAYPLDMSQYFRLFNSTRIPKKDKDILFTDEKRNHILVVHKGRYFVFPVLDNSGNILPAEELYACIHHILNNTAETNDLSLGVLTSLNRTKWADLREKLENISPKNKDSLNLIDTSLYCLALDDIETDDPDQLSSNFLYGDCKNRWFDKSISLILTKNAHAAINFEHSWGDGVAVLRLFNELFDDSSKNSFINSKSKPVFDKGDISKVVQELGFHIDDSIKGEIKNAQEEYKNLTSKVHLKNFELKTYGRNLVKQAKLSPDSIMQSGIQIAYYKTYGRTVATYESASTSAFKYGRTETIRSNTMETKRLCEYLAKGGRIDNEDIMTLLKDCTKLHNQLVKEGAMGQGFDRHLFAMKYHLQNKRETNMSPLFNSNAYKLINHNILSTSTLAYPTILTGGFAPVVPDGFGVGYRILDNSLGACVSSYQRSELNKFVAQLEETFEMMNKILKNWKKKD